MVMFLKKKKIACGGNSNIASITFNVEKTGALLSGHHFTLSIKLIPPYHQETAFLSITSECMTAYGLTAPILYHLTR